MGHEFFLHKALEQARLGRGKCAPNPSVGAVAVQGETLLAVGHHEGPGSAHAEYKVISQLTGDASAVTLYVTLEPCNHWGRTPPCVDAIVKSGIKRVVYAYVDPNPLVAQNNTTALLEEKGVEVVFYPLPEINAFYESYAYWSQFHLPFVTAKMASSLDGKIAQEGGSPVVLSNRLCGIFTHTQRAATDWILTTAQTIIQDNPILTARIDGQEQGKQLAILDRQLRVPRTARLFEKAERVLLFHDATRQVSSPYPGCEYVPIPAHPLLDLSAVFMHLAQRGAHDVWVEAGGHLFTNLHLAGLVQRTYLYLTTHLLGEAAVSVYRDKTIFQRQHSVSWRIFEDNVLLTLDFIPEQVSQSCLPA